MILLLGIFMKHAHISAFDIPDSWYRALREIWDKGDIFPVRYGSETTETKKLNISIEILNPENRPLISDKASCDMKYVQGYALRYLWAGEKEEGETYTYASRLRKPIDQVDTAINRFVEEPFDRQVTLLIRRPEDILKELEKRRHEPPCWTILDLEITKDNNCLKMHTTGYFRSWDAVGGYPANVAGLQIFNEAFVNELNERGIEKHREEWKQVSTGKMIWHCKNLHIYERQYPLVESLFKSQKQKTFSEKMTDSK
jgi:thymidylate synthase